MMSVNKVVAELAPAEAVASLEMTESLHQYKDLNNDAGSCEADGKRKKNALKTSYEYICVNSIQCSLILIYQFLRMKIKK
jgi:hypothetical protein